MFIWTPQDSMLHVCLSTTTHMYLGILFFSNLGVVPLSTFQIFFFQPFRKMKKFLYSITTPIIFELEGCVTTQIIEIFKGIKKLTYYFSKSDVKKLIYAITSF